MPAKAGSHVTGMERVVEGHSGGEERCFRVGEDWALVEGGIDHKNTAKS